ncbi:DNA-processing protein DprA [Paenibacillus xerothermodurans]|uniref:DNA-protecting protein DprA n=1 Tax=Paenibacillus xerothermodurans TaxID=1977292 RepID=A0A2W1NSC5_PAEXE|nr:DNA-processing protein DprA [Paenibacillus xerothermodurans]PZE22465.1 DNA-protecting protein DprA [Paenibacillus xerothermodurans]
MNNRSILIALNHLPGIGWKTIQQIVAQFPCLADALALQPDQWKELGMLSSKAHSITAALRQVTPAYLMQLLDRYNSHGIQILTIYDEEYPVLLTQTAQPPWVLYCHGKVHLLNAPCIAVVGTRTPTVYGRKIAEQLSGELASASVCVVSGLARGIDTAAHCGALSQSGGTIAVLGCGIGQVYPRENHQLYERILKEGLIISEYPLDTKAHPGLFPQRNRIIAGLSQGVLVVEAALRSGSLITADQALEESRDVFAVPGPITSPKSQGALSLIKQGAKLVSDVSDILEEYPQWIAGRATTNSNYAQQTQSNLSADEQTIVSLLQNQAMSIDELLVSTEFTFGHLHSLLLNLLLTKRVEQLPGSLYAFIRLHIS